jgi:UDP-2,3-diacylglucosamine pyrophosphatase LpxH
VGYAWARAPGSGRELRLPADRPVWFVSDLHLGDGTGSDAFMGKDRLLLEVVNRAREAGARLVICGDGVDVLQATDLTPVIRAHGRLLRALTDFPQDRRVVYLHGNHDDDIRVYEDILNFDVAERLRIGDELLALHGHQFDPFIAVDLSKSGQMTRMHHTVERKLGVWIRVPMSDFYNIGNRLAFWLFYRGWQLIKVRNLLFRQIGLRRIAEHSQAFFTHWARCDQGSGLGMVPQALACARAEGVGAVVCGHNHMPGNFALDGTRFVNTGSWTFGWAQLTRWEAGTFVVEDLPTNRLYTDELYRSWLDGELDHLDFDKWWRNQYLGWFRFRGGELRREAMG